MPSLLKTEVALLAELRGLIKQAANSALSLLYWKLGARIQREMLQCQRAQYGGEILPTLSAKLRQDNGEDA